MSNSIKTDPSFLTKAITGALTGEVMDNKPKKSIQVFVADDATMEGETNENGLIKSILKLIDDPNDKSKRLAFTTDPSHPNTYAAVYKDKNFLIPDSVLKKIAIRDDLVSSIVWARSWQISSFGRPRPTRFDKGFILETRRETTEKINAEPDEEIKKKKKADLQSRKDIAERKIMNCGDSQGWQDEDRLTFSQYLLQSTRNAIVNGRIATEILYKTDGSQKKKFYGWRVIDAGTIFRATPQQDAAAAVRKQSRILLDKINGDKKNRPTRVIAPEPFLKDDYAWVQVIDDIPRQAFKAEECLVHNFFPVPDVELDGYPVTPIDTAVSAILTHLSISTHNRLYFQNGRASRGMLVIRSDDMAPKQVESVKRLFNASVNGVEKSYRMPIFSVGKEDEIEWQSIDSSARDGEFQTLADNNARVIFAAFQMSPEEVPAWAHLTKGTSSQALSESNNEWKSEVARDQGIRPLLAQFENFMNQALMPLIDPELAEMVIFKLVGLDAETAEKESVRTQQDMNIHMTMDEVLEKVEKRPVGRSMGGEFLLNPAYQTVLDKYFTVGYITERCFGVEGASQDPRLDYMRDPFFFQQVARMDAKEQQAQAAQQAQQQADQQAQQGPPQSGGDGSDGGGPQAQAKAKANPHPNQLKGKDAIDPKQITDGIGKDPSQLSPEQQGLARNIEIGIDLLKNEDLSDSQKKVVAYQKGLVDEVLKGWEADTKIAVEEITGLANRFAPAKKKK
jgi:hypothetical protein